MRGGREIELTARELKLLEFLMRRVGQVVTRTMLLEGVWDLHFDPQSNLIDVHISRLRQAVDNGSENPLIHTIRGSGYVLRDSDAMSAHPEVSGLLCAPADLRRSTRPAGARGKPDPFNTTAFRLSVGYTLLVTLAVAVTLGSAYLLTQSLITEDVDLIIDTEMKGLNDKFNRSGLSGLTDEINLRIDSWGRVGAVYLLVDKKYEQIAGNVEQWPFKGMPAERRPEFTHRDDRAGTTLLPPGARGGAHAPRRKPASGRHRHLPGSARSRRNSGSPPSGASACRPSRPRWRDSGSAASWRAASRM